MAFQFAFLAILVVSVPSNGVPLLPSLDTLTSLVASPSNGCPDNSCQVNPIPCCQPCPVEEKKPCPVEPQCQECPVDLSQSTNRGLGKAWQVILQGKALESTLAQSLASPFVLKYDALAAAASSLPGVLAAKGELLGKMLVVPVQYTAAKSSALAQGLAHAVVGLPVAVGTGIAAGAAGVYEAITDIQNQKNCHEDVCARPVHDVAHVQGDEPTDVQADGMDGRTGDVEAASVTTQVVDVPSVPEATTTFPSMTSLDILAGGIL